MFLRSRLLKNNFCLALGTTRNERGRAHLPHVPVCSYCDVLSLVRLFDNVVSRTVDWLRCTHQCCWQHDLFDAFDVHTTSHKPQATHGGTGHYYPNKYSHHPSNQTTNLVLSKISTKSAHAKKTRVVASEDNFNQNTINLI